MVSKPLRVMVVQDDIRVAARLARQINACGEIVIGPFQTVEQAMKSTEGVQAAILNVTTDRNAYSMADWLMDSDVPFVFVTAQEPLLIPPRFEGHRAYRMPYHAASLLIDLHRQQRDLAVRHDDDPKAVVVDMMKVSRSVMPDFASADRLVEAALVRAVSQSVESGLPSRFRPWLMTLLEDEIQQRRRHLH